MAVHAKDVVAADLVGTAIVAGAAGGAKVEASDIVEAYLVSPAFCAALEAAAGGRTIKGA